MLELIYDHLYNQHKMESKQGKKYTLSDKYEYINKALEQSYSNFKLISIAVIKCSSNKPCIMSGINTLDSYTVKYTIIKPSEYELVDGEFVEKNSSFEFKAQLRLSKKYLKKNDTTFNKYLLNIRERTMAD